MIPKQKNLNPSIVNVRLAVLIALASSVFLVFQIKHRIAEHELIDDCFLNHYDQKPILSSHPSGFAVLGMHRSGTSMLSGALVTYGYDAGNDLMPPTSDNPRGYFEDMSLYKQNVKLLHNQGLNWDSNNHTLVSFRQDEALQTIEHNPRSFKDGCRTVSSLLSNKNGNKQNQLAALKGTQSQRRRQQQQHQRSSWLIKDPRLCITLPVWRKFINPMPAVVFTYRHPISVANSLHKRDGMSMSDGLRLWIDYNYLAITNSRGLCRVVTSNEDVIANPYNEIKRISDELYIKCGINPPQKSLTYYDDDDVVDTMLQQQEQVRQRSIDDFVDIKLQHNTNHNYHHHYGGSGADALCENDKFLIVPITHMFYEQVYVNAMRIYCDIRSGEAFHDDYTW